MKNKTISILVMIIVIFITAFASFNICNKKNKRQIETVKNNCSQLNEETCIKFLESGNQLALNYISAYKNKKMNSTLETYIENIEKSFSQDIDFIKLFKKDVEKISEFREENIKSLYPDSEMGGSMSSMLYNGSSEGFEQAEIILLEQVVIAYCSNRQDYQPCIDTVFNKK